MLLGGGVHGGGVRGARRLLSAESVALLTTNHLTAEQVASAGIVLRPKGWGYGMAVAVEPDEMSAVAGRYGGTAGTAQSGSTIRTVA